MGFAPRLPSSPFQLRRRHWLGSGLLGLLGLRFALGIIYTLTGLGLADLLLLHLVCEGILVGVGHHVQFFQHTLHQPVLVHPVVRQVR